MRIAVLSDVHGNHVALNAVLEQVRQQADVILFLGDLAGYYPFVNECVEMWPVDRTLAILGNHDRVLLDCISRGTPPDASYRLRYGSALERALSHLSPQSREMLRSWPEERHIQIDSTRVAMYHGAPWDPLDGRVYPDATGCRFEDCAEEIILLGHTHYAMTREWHGKLVINPGSVGQPRDRSAGAAYALLDLPERKVTLERAAYDCHPLVEDAHRNDPGLTYLAEVLLR